MKNHSPRNPAADDADFASARVFRFEAGNLTCTDLFLPRGPETVALLAARRRQAEQDQTLHLQKQHTARVAEAEAAARPPGDSLEPFARARKKDELDPEEEAAQLHARAKTDARDPDPERVPVYEIDEPLRLVRNLRVGSSDRDVHDRKRQLYLRLKAKGHLRRCPYVAPLAESAIEALREAQPHFGPVLDLILGQVALARARCAPLQLPPLLLLGEPGVGKTYFSQQLAALLGVPLRRQSFDAGATDALLLGSDKHWGNTTHGLVFEMLCLGDVANPVILLDEIDKPNRRREHDPLAPLHSLLEPVTARAVRDISVDLEFDASHITWITTANALTRIPDSLRSRFTVFEIVAPSGAQALQTAQAIARSVHAELGVVGFAPPPRQVVTLLAHLTAREQVKALHRAYASALRQGRHSLRTTDLPSDVRDDGTTPPSSDLPPEQLH